MLNKLFAKDELKILWPFYLGFFVLGFSALITPYMMVYFVNLGFSYKEIAFVLSGVLIGTILFEVPTGALADGVSRKYSVILGAVVMALGAGLIPFFDNVFVVCLLWLFVGLGQTFWSGAYDAWVVDNLKHMNREDLQKEFFIKGTSIHSSGLIFAPLAAAFILQYLPMKSLWWFLAGGVLLNGFILLIPPEHFVSEKKNITQLWSELINNTKEGTKLLFTNKALKILLLGSVVTTFMSIGDIGLEPFLIDIGAPLASLGVIVSIIGVFGIVIPMLSKLFSRWKIREVITFTLIIPAVLLPLILLVNKNFLLLGFIIYLLPTIGPLLRGPLVADYSQKHIPSKIRATTSSASSMILALVALLIIQIGGFLLDILPTPYVISLGGVFAIVAMFVYWRLPD